MKEIPPSEPQSPRDHHQKIIESLRSSSNITISDVRELLDAERTEFQSNAHLKGYLRYINTILSQWDKGNRFYALEYLFRRAFPMPSLPVQLPKHDPIWGFVKDYEAYVEHATVFVHCGACITEAGLCNNPKEYQEMHAYIQKRRKKHSRFPDDPELYDALDAALTWSELNTRYSDPEQLQTAYERYNDCRTALFGHDVLARK